MKTLIKKIIKFRDKYAIPFGGQKWTEGDQRDLERLQAQLPDYVKWLEEEKRKYEEQRNES